MDDQNDMDELMALRAERDAALAELEAIKSSGWRNHSVNYARAEKCPQTLETAQAAWDRDQELIEEQRQQIAKDSQTINDLRQKLEACRKDAERLNLLADCVVIEGFVGVEKDIYDLSCEVAEGSGREEPSEDDQRQAFRLLIDAFRAKEANHA